MKPNFLSRWALCALLLTPWLAFAAEAPLKGTVAASQTDSSLVAAVSGQRVCVYQMALIVGATATDVTLNTKGAGAGTSITPPFSFGANGGVVLPNSPKPWFCTTSGEALTMTTGAGSTTGYLLRYSQAP